VKRLEEAENILQKWRRRAEGGIATEVHPSLLEALGDDLNTPDYIKTLSATGIPASTLISGGDLLGLDLRPKQADFDVSKYIKKRLEFINAKDWTAADRIRDELLLHGIQLKDGKDPATGERVTTWEVKR
jgi:cysteinyl-tRNA synthetase